MHKLQRTTFESSRAGEYFDARERQAQTGQPSSNFAVVALKELANNALDACETVGVAPEVSVEVHEEGELIWLTISDNWPGIPPETVHKVLDFNTRTSDKAAYRSPTKLARTSSSLIVVARDAPNPPKESYATSNTRFNREKSWRKTPQNTMLKLVIPANLPYQKLIADL